jgi:hypothetical protein
VSSAGQAEREASWWVWGLRRRRRGGGLQAGRAPERELVHFPRVKNVSLAHGTSPVAVLAEEAETSRNKNVKLALLFQNRGQCLILGTR